MDSIPPIDRLRQNRIKRSLPVLDVVVCPDLDDDPLLPLRLPQQRVQLIGLLDHLLQLIITSLGVLHRQDVSSLEQLFEVFIHYYFIQKIREL